MRQQLEVAGVAAQAGREVFLNASELISFDSSALSVLLSAVRMCRGLGLQLRVQGAPRKLRELALLYGIDELIWASELQAA
jgi:phospholipid transport system transporter-binding protein